MPINRYRIIVGFTLIELLVFIITSSMIILALSVVYKNSLTVTSQLIIDRQWQLLAKSQVENIISHKYDENSGENTQPCDIAIKCMPIGLDNNESFKRLETLDDIDDFNGYQDIPVRGVFRRVEVSYIGDELGIKYTHAKRIKVMVSDANGQYVMFSTIRVNH